MQLNTPKNKTTQSNEHNCKQNRLPKFEIQRFITARCWHSLIIGTSVSEFIQKQTQIENSETLENSKIQKWKTTAAATWATKLLNHGFCWDDWSCRSRRTFFETSSARTFNIFTLFQKLANWMDLLLPAPALMLLYSPTSVPTSFSSSCLRFPALIKTGACSWYCASFCCWWCSKYIHENSKV